MFGNEFIQNFSRVPIPPQDLNDGAVDSEWISLANYGHATVFIDVGDTAGATFAVTINEATTNTGTGEQVLTYTKLSSTSQKLMIDTVVGTFVVGETLTQTGGASNTAEIYKVSKDYLIVRSLTNGTTWTDNAVITGGTSGATAAMDGTGQDEDGFVPTYTAPSSTFTIPATTFKTYVIEIDADSLTVADGYDHIQVALSDPTSATIAGGCVILSKPRHRDIPMPSAIGAQKIVATSA